MRTLVMYGAYVLSGGNPNIGLYTNDGARSHIVDVQVVENARSAGATPVNARVTSKPIELKAIVKRDKDSNGNTIRSVEDVWTELNRALEEKGKWLRFMKNWYLLSSPVTDTGWILSDDAVNRSYIRTSRWFDGAIQFDVDVSASGNNQATLTNTENSGVDLSSYYGRGNFEFFMDIPDIDQVTGVLLHVGSDSSNYLSYTFTTQADGSPIQEGRNLFSVAWSETDKTGSVDAGLMGRYIVLQLQYNAGQGDISSVVFGGLIWQLDDETHNWKVFSEGIEDETVRDFEDFRSGILKFLAYRGVGEGTSQELIYIESGISSVSKDINVELLGSYTPEPVIQIKFTGVTNLAGMVFTNKTTKDSLTITRTWTANDILEIDIPNQLVKVNNVQIDYSSVLPRFKLGINRLNITLNASNENTISQTTNNANLKGETA